MSLLGLIIWPFWLVSGCQQHTLRDVEGIEIQLVGSNFEQEVLQSDLPVLVDFGATWCPPCRELNPVIATLSNDYEGRVKVGKVDVDDSPELAEEYDIEGLPTLVLYRNGKEVDRLVGAGSYRAISRLMDSVLPTTD